ncbi:hypothetical protein [Dyadobacter sp. 3J3]|uniref:hypothetical protein n=1 Tax=Dyadobacter sp. 3J3 TaxID=2606600 RepID=UPI00135A8204|nr:hypothetical protein [Dyadobacter sp. 3J3]
MKRLFYIPLLLILLLNCKKDKIDTQPDEIMKPLVGKWHLTETEETVNGKKMWVPVTLTTVYVTFRFDGILLDEKEMVGCCATKIYNINNTKFEVIPRAAVPYYDCSTVYCAACPSYDIEFNGNEMIISRCNSARSKYIRVE